MMVTGMMTMWMLSVNSGELMSSMSVVGMWVMMLAMGMSQSKVMSEMGVLGGWYNSEEMMVNMEGYMYMMSMMMMMGYMKSESEAEEVMEESLEEKESGKSEESSEEGWEMEVEVVLMAMMGMVMLMWSNDLVATYLGMELQSLALYMMTSSSEEGTGAMMGMKYYMLGMLSSSMLLMGMVMMYKEMGTTNNEGMSMMQETWGEGKMGELGGYLMMSGMLFKLALPPFHNWAPDVYDGVETSMTTWMAVMGKMSYMMYMYKVSMYEMGMMEGVMVGALMVGSVMGLTQNSMKSLMAYSTMNQMGYPLMGMLTTGMMSSVSFMFYNMQYWVTLMNSFCMMMALGGSKEVKYMTSLYSESPVLLMALVMNMYSLMGMPPLMGFFGKQMVMSGGLLGGYVGMVTVAMMTSVMSGGYYLSVMKEMVLKDSGMESEEMKGLLAKSSKNKGEGYMMWVMSVMTLMTMLYGVNPSLMVVPMSMMLT